MVQFSPRAVTPLAAVEHFIKSRGDLSCQMSDFGQIGAICLKCVCLETPLALNVLNPAPTMRLKTAAGSLADDQLPLLPPPHLRRRGLLFSRSGMSIQSSEPGWPASSGLQVICSNGSFDFRSTNSPIWRTRPGYGLRRHSEQPDC
jgi:hypothetical protein